MTLHHFLSLSALDKEVNNKKPIQGLTTIQQWVIVDVK